MVNYIAKRKYSYLLFIFPLLYSLSFYLYTELDDVFYWYNQAYFPKHSYMTGFSLWIGHLWRDLVGDNILYYRLLGYIISIITIVVPYFSLQSKQKQRENIMWLLIASFFVGSFTQSMYSPDSMTNLLLLLIATVVLKYNITNYKTIIVLAILSGLLSAARIPNILILPCVMVLIFLCGQYEKHECKKTFIILFLYLCLSLFTYTILSLLFFDSSLLNIVSRSPNIIGGGTSGSELHSLKYIFKWYLFSCKYFVLSFTSIVGCYIIFKRLHILYPKLKILWVIVEIIGLVFVFKTYGFKVFFSCSCVILMILYGYQQKEKHLLYKITFVALLGFIACAGSNTGFMKIYPYYVAMLPLILIKYKEKIEKEQFVKVVLCVMLFFSIGTNYSFILYLDEYLYRFPIYKYSQIANYEHYKGLMTIDEAKKRDARLDDFKKYGRKDFTLFYGRPQCHEMYAITNSRQYYPVPFYMYADDDNLIKKNIRYLKEDERIVLFDYTKSELMKSRLIAEGYVLTEGESDVNIYKRQ